MGCGASANYNVDNTTPANWIGVTIKQSGNIMLTPANGGQATDVLAQMTLQRVPGKDLTKKWHFVEQKIGGTWDETKLGGQVKFTCLGPVKLDAMWKEVGAKPFLSEGTTTTASTEASANSQGTPKRQSVSKSLHVGGVAEWQGKVFVMQGAINDTVMVVEKESGDVVLTLTQSHCGNNLKFYDTSIPGGSGKRVSVSGPTQEQKDVLDKAFCGSRDKIDDDEDIHLFLNPATLEKIPVSLFAMAAMYSSFSLNDVPC